ncbi:HD domain-containing protein [Halobacteria archaeon AArc-m2/3/4]|uniref:HD domain-containing protein n=1 Tax=Natronoglomus mannanivorans TaxID=2979990 RepID=A0ABT2QK37_9EURY|nr:HD domain-containing protein [Halobacteria archaeon AArc-m2/3/4]
MTVSSDLECIRAVAKSYFDAHDQLLPAHDWHHVQRVETLAERLAAARSTDDRVLGLAVLLHDIGRGKEDAGEIDDHAAWGAEEARRILSSSEEFGLEVVDGLPMGDIDVADETIDAVGHCIRAHRYSNDVEPTTLEARILSDADNLDALGAIGIARVFSYGGEKGTAIHDPAVPIEEDDSRAGRTSVNHIHKKILELPDRMYTDEGRELAAERTRVVVDFVDRLEAEVSGQR